MQIRESSRLSYWLINIPHYITQETVISEKKLYEPKFTDDSLKVILKKSHWILPNLYTFDTNTFPLLSCQHCFCDFIGVCWHWIWYICNPCTIYFCWINPYEVEVICSLLNTTASQIASTLGVNISQQFSFFYINWQVTPVMLTFTKPQFQIKALIQ